MNKIKLLIKKDKNHLSTKNVRPSRKLHRRFLCRLVDSLYLFRNVNI